MAEPITPLSLSSDKGIKPITNRTPEAFQKQLGTLIDIGEKDHAGRTIYVRHPKRYTLDGENITQFSLYGKQSIEQTGINSGQAHMLLFKNKDPYYQSTLMQIPNDRGELPWKTIGAVSFIDKNGEKVTIPRNELTLRKPKSPGEPKETTADITPGPSRDAALHEDYDEDITKPVLPEENAPYSSGDLDAAIHGPDDEHDARQVLVGMADGRQTNPEGVNDGGAQNTVPNLNERYAQNKPTTSDRTETPWTYNSGINPDDQGGDQTEHPPGGLNLGANESPPKTEEKPWVYNSGENTDETGGSQIETPPGGLNPPPQEQLPETIQVETPIVNPEPAVPPVEPVVPSPESTTPSNQASVAPASAPSVINVEPEPTTAPVTPETPERRSSLSFIGIDRETVKRRAMDLAKTAIEGTRDILKKFFAERFEEKYYQHYLKILDAAQTPFAKESITIAQSEAKKRYDTEMKKRNVVSRSARKTWDWIKDHSFGTTTMEQYTIDAMEHMTDPVLQRERESFARERQQTAKRFEGAFNDSDIDIRKNLGEKLVILEKPEHKPLVDGIKGIVKEYYTQKPDGTSMSEGELQNKLDTFYAHSIKTATVEGKQIFSDAETYASSLTAVAKEMRSRIEHGEGLSALDAELATMEVRLGIGTMGEATEIRPTETRKAVAKVKNTVDWLVRNGVIRNVLLNDATVGTAVSAVLALKMLPQSVLSSTARMWLGAAGGGAVAGIFAGRREFVRRQGEIRRVGAQKEAGIVPSAGDKQRQWYEAFDFRLRTVDELVDGMQKSMYTADGKLKATLTEDELRTSLANLADAKARKILSSREKDRFGLITLGSIGEQEANRTRLDTLVKQTEKDLAHYLDTHRNDAAVTTLMGGAGAYGTAGSEGSAYMKALTDAQISVLTEGNGVLNHLADPHMKLALSPLSAYTPEVDKLRYTLGIFGKTENRKSIGTGSGIDELLKDFKKQATAESARVGLKTAGTGIAIGAITNEIVMDLKYGWGSGAISGIFHPHSEIGKIINAATTHSVDIGGHNVMLGSNMTVDANGNLDIIDAAGRIHHDVIPNLSNHVTFDPNGTMHMDQFAIDHLGKAGIASTLSQDVVPGVDHTTVLRTHAEALTHGVRITDAAGVAHSPSWELPDGTHFVATDNTHYNLVRDIAGGRHETLLSQIAINDHGKLLDVAGLQNQINQFNASHPAYHLNLGAETTQSFTLPGVDKGNFDARIIHFLPQNQMATVPTITHPGEVFGITDRGIWEVFEHDTTTEQGTNAVKHIMRAYHLYDVNNSGVDVRTGQQVIAFDDIKGMAGLQRTLSNYYHDTIWGKALHYNALPNNTVVTLPGEFSTSNVALLDQWTNDSVRTFAQHVGVTTGSHDAMMAGLKDYFSLHGVDRAAIEATFGGDRLGWLMFKSGYIGMEQDVLTKDELQFVFNSLHTTGPGSIVDLFKDIISAQSITHDPDVVTNIFTVAREGVSPEGFIPIIPIVPRKGLEPLSGKPITPPRPPRPTPPKPIPPTPPIDKGGSIPSTTGTGASTISTPTPPSVPEEEEIAKKRRKEEDKNEEAVSKPPAVEEPTAAGISIPRSEKEVNPEQPAELPTEAEEGKKEEPTEEVISGGTPPPAVTPIEIPVAEVPPETETAESKPESEFDSQIPIDPASYNALAARYNELRKKAVKEKNDSKLTRLGSLPIGKIINAAWPNGDTVEARIAYHEISKLLDELENSPTSPSEETVAEETPTQEAPEPGREDIKLPLAEDENLRKALEQLENAS